MNEVTECKVKTNEMKAGLIAETVKVMNCERQWNVIQSTHFSEFN